MIVKPFKVLVVILCFALSPVFSTWASDFNVAFYYGAHAPIDELKAFDIVVVDPDQGLDPSVYRTANSELFAYVSVGELQSYRSYASAVPGQWVLGENKAWGSRIIDLSLSEWPKFFVTRIIGPLWNQGYRGFFLDTLDSYQLVANTPEDLQKQTQGLIAVIRAIKKAYPEAKLIFNRGFEIIPRVSEHVYAVAVESLFQGWNQTDKRYVEVPEKDRQWLLGQLGTLRNTYHLPIIIIDYLPPKDREGARTLAKKIQDLGMIPWISTPEMNVLGVGGVEVMPRKVLSVFDGNQGQEAGHSELHRFVDMPLNYLGYVPEHWNAGKILPEYPLVGRYAGIVTWLSRDNAQWSQAFHQWLVKQIAQGVPVVVFNSFGFPIQNDLLKPFQLKTGPHPTRITQLSFTVKDKRVGYEIQPVASRRTFFPLNLLEGQPLLQLKTNAGDRQDIIAFTSWGGYALNPLTEVKLPGLGTEYRWVIDPILFLKEALRLHPMPVPDPTTENGRRLLLVHVDGDGFPSRAEMPGTPFAGEVLYREILKQYPIPTTVSIIEGEVGPTGVFPNLSRRFEKIIRSIFALPHIELASHSYSHPFFWRDFMTKGKEKPGHYHMDIPGYVYDRGNVKREIRGSIEYINYRLAPKNKPVKVFLWSGDCDPEPAAVKEAYALNVGNMNGGDTRITKQYNSLTAVAPLGIDKGGYFQIYAPNQNENIYTNNWLGPFYGYQQVIETFQLTESPRRLKPINIYYHTYSASKKASLVALHKVYRWALDQPIYPIYVSEYIQKVQEFNRIVVARTGKEWRVRGAHYLRELRTQIGR
ncbi:MAG: bifunctional glycoside hydrolase 114/ polysaccharide deacetylase family protein, partial [Nitrospirota bacterium]|nr:bifunctional glycoside hydrolase 114/ polysaccharide deacetylase family protein [Nitrospirota bacterium]